MRDINILKEILAQCCQWFILPLPFANNAFLFIIPTSSEKMPADETPIHYTTKFN